MFYKLFQAALCFALGVICHFAMAPYNMPLVLFAGFSCLYYILQRTEKKRFVFLNTWLFAFGYFLFGLSWIANALLVPGNEAFLWVYPLALIGLPVLLGLFPAVCITYIAKKARFETLSGWLAFVFAFSLAEVARGFLFTGFPWNNFAYTWINVPPISQVVSIGGLYLLSTLTIFWCSLPALAFLHKRKASVFMIFLLGAGTFAGSYFWGWQKLQTEQLETTNSVKLHLIQPNILQEEKWRGDLMAQHFKTLMDLSEAALQPNVTNIVIWPETASVDRLINQDPYSMRLKQLLPAASNNFLITGLLRRERSAEDNITHYNSLITFGPDATIVGIYDKSHLVPFGEYVPFQKFIPLDPVVNFSGFAAGPGPQSIALNDVISISPLICYEIIFPGRSLPDTRFPSTLIVNVTNDAWYGDSAGPRQHLVKARFRAIETGIPVARVANTGISALISAHGEILSEITYGQRAYKSASLPLPLQNETYFAKLGHKLSIAFLIFLGVLGYCFRTE